MESRPANSAHDPVDMVKSTVGLLYLFAITEASVAKTIERNKLDPNSIMKDMEDLPSLTDDHLDQALSVIPQNYWRVTCSTCRHQGHLTSCDRASPSASASSSRTATKCIRSRAIRS